ncbi:hypothetical protein BROUX41_003049 [Berkeleyomyces rouxiae]|uniref:uncharacterized protein n=1 Tax=Berkeleyomyces rouxiae TaxID=2035830 RepID=UPI003B7D3A71
MNTVQIPRTGLMQVLSQDDHRLYIDWRDELLELSADYGVSEYLTPTKETPEATLLALPNEAHMAARAKRLLAYYIDPYFLMNRFPDFKKISARDVLFKLDAHFGTSGTAAYIRIVREMEEIISKSQTTNPLVYSAAMSH